MSVHHLRVSRPFDYQRDGDADHAPIAVHLVLTALEVNLMCAWLEHDQAPRSVTDLGSKIRHQIGGAL